MKKFYSHTLLYLHETIALGSERSDRFTEKFTGVYQPMMEQLGARLFSIWETTPYNGHWPQVTIIWEIEAFADYARIGRAEAPGGSHREAAAAWSDYLAGIGASGEGDGDWDCFENHYPSWKDSPPAETVTWMSVAPALRDGWEDSILQALPPSPLR